MTSQYYLGTLLALLPCYLCCHCYLVTTVALLPLLPCYLCYLVTTVTLLSLLPCITFVRLLPFFSLLPYYFHLQYVGVLIDANLNFKQHVDNHKLLVKLSKRIGVLGRIRNNITVDSSDNVYQSLVYPVMDYCDNAWSSIGKIERERLDRAQRRETKDPDAEKNLKLFPLHMWRDLNTINLTLVVIYFVLGFSFIFLANQKTQLLRLAFCRFLGKVSFLFLVVGN